MNFIHRLFNPHCPHCALLDARKREQEIEDKVCNNCETLRQIISALQREKQQLLDALLEKHKVEEPSQTDVKDLKPILTNSYVPFHVRRQQLEQESRKAAQLRKSAPQPDDKEHLDKLEKEVLQAEVKRENAH